MKKRNLTKIITLVLSCVLLVAGVVGISASAAEGDASAEFELVTLNYGADVKIAYAVSLTGIDAADAALYLYNNEELSGEPVVSRFSGSYYDNTYPIYYSYGVAAKDLADYVYAVPVELSTGNAIGGACRYSVAQYCYSVLANSESSDDLRSLAGDLITYGASAQQRLINIGNIADETLVSSYNYVYTVADGVSVEDAYTTTLLAPGATFTPAYTGAQSVVEWKLTAADGAVTAVSAADAANGISVTSSTKVEPVFFKPEGFDEGSLETDTVVTGGSWTTNSAEIASDPTDATNNVLKVTQTHGSGSGTMYATTVSLANPDASGNCYTFEAKFYFTDLTVDGVTMQDCIQMVFRDADNNRAAGYGFKTSTDGSKVSLNLRHNAQANNSVTDFYGSGVAVKADQWYTLRYELYATGEASTYMTKIYIGHNDFEPVCVAEVNAYTSSLLTDITNLNIAWQKWDTNYTVYVDDLSLVKSDKSFVTSNSATTAETFDAEDASVYLNSYNRIYSTYTEGGSTPSVSADPTDSANNVLKVQKVAQGASAYTYVKPYDTETDANCTYYSSRIYFGTPTNTGDYIVAFSFRTADGYAVKLNFGVTYGATDTIYLRQDSGTAKHTDFNGNDISITPDAWYNIVFEIYDLGDGTGVTKVYISADGEEPVCVTEIAVAEIAEVSQMVIDFGKNKTASAVYLDDVMFKKIVKTYASETAAE